MQPKTLTPDQMTELQGLLESIEYRLVTTDSQMLAEARHGDVLTPENSFQLHLDKEFAQMRRVFEILGLPRRFEGGDEPIFDSDEATEKPTSGKV